MDGEFLRAMKNIDKNLMDGERVKSCWIYKEPLMRWIEERK